MASALEYLMGVPGAAGVESPAGACRTAMAQKLAEDYLGGMPIVDTEVHVPFVFCGFIPGTIHAETTIVRADGKARVAVTNTTIPTPDAASRCIVLHQDGSSHQFMESQAFASSEVWEIEVRLRDCSLARLAADDILAKLEFDGVLQAVVARYDEPGNGDLNYGAHSLVVQLPSVCPDA